MAGAVVLLAMAQPTTTMQMGGAGLLVVRPETNDVLSISAPTSESFLI